MGRGQTTRDAIVNEALRQASRVGLEGLSLAPLADSLSLSKSGLFAHFKSKEVLQLGILDEAIDRFKRQVAVKAFGKDDPVKKLRTLFDSYLTWIRGTANDGGCLFMTMAQEYDDRPGEIRKRLVASQRAWRDVLRALVLEGMDSASFRADSDIDQFVFEFMGAALAYQHADKLMGDAKARQHALGAFDRALADISH